MVRASTRSLVVFLGMAVVYLGPVPHAKACCLTDWMFRRRQPTPVVVNYAAAPAYPVAPVAPAPVAPAAPAGGCCGPGQCEETVVRYVPEMAYRTVWQPVPVTTYRRTVSYNPATGLPITCTQPCTTYTYQARRVPYTSFRPVYTTVPVERTGDADRCHTNPDRLQQLWIDCGARLRVVSGCQQSVRCDAVLGPLRSRFGGRPARGHTVAARWTHGDAAELQRMGSRI